MIDNYEDSFHEKISENQQDLDEIDGQIGGLEDKIAQLNKIVCSTPKLSTCINSEISQQHLTVIKHGVSFQVF